ncbi:MAG: nicotinamide-nucleotide amidohydrolase family protein [Chloroflexi bacterium]|jgi:nicotinate (nicotinamide) nucleotide adenylyltransferase|nr:nicotinamide-nucleotide amidohydrolase family protein [Anaerolineaceae bacterium]NLI45109.1 nicotinamide-nucleotide amidohydrolase family protein [Chloroflexota bacterium]HOE34359.1 nicotinamide-nucleotide amidohydrolase family protein [Anaerolineaceae bacterium]HOT25640.1 nicotinamide-nucleotide amidohydrolase family protein [Anaerolineaceae bacterium]HQH57274.1 nicotinamide-nucleotide amidohydrolase family protein [Anaerolineaceae bacterium]
MSNNQPLLLVFGSSADPFHKGHSALVVAAARALTRRGWQVEEIMLLPVYRHHNTLDAVKRSLPFTFEHRFAICQLAAGDIARELAGTVERVSVSRLEEEIACESHRPNLSAETFARLREQCDPRLRLAFLLGADSISGEDPSLNHWFNLEELLRLTALVICPRQGFAPNLKFIGSLEAKGAQIILLDEARAPEISSSEIRKELEQGAEPERLVQKGWLSPAAADYIRQNRLVAIWKELDSSVSAPKTALQAADAASLEARIGRILSEHKWTLALAESCTGGLISHRITNIPGSSEYYIGGVVAYAYAAKVALLGVRWETLQRYGAVSSETVLEMARGAREVFKTDFALSVSCIAGPGGATPNKPVGTSWVGLAAVGKEWSRHFLLSGDRVSNKETLAQKALEMLLEFISAESAGRAKK